MVEPPLVPDYQGDLKPDRYYCLECVHQTTTEHEMKDHHRKSHDNESAMSRIDYAPGDRVSFMRRVRESWIAEQTAFFASEMHDGFTADDFVAEAEIRSA